MDAHYETIAQHFKILDKINMMLKYGSYTDNNNPILQLDALELSTSEKREHIYENFLKNSEGVSHQIGTHGVQLPQNIILAQIEHYLRELVHNERHASATTIQKHIRGVLTRCKKGVHNPYCEIGNTFLRNIFTRLQLCP